MPFTQYDILLECSLTLQDRTFTRWMPSDLNLWLNAGLSEISLHKPNVMEQTQQAVLDIGTLQQIPPGYFQILRAVRNIGTYNPVTAVASYAPGPSIVEATRQELDAVIPGWSDPNTVPFTDAVEHIIYDAAEPTKFYVYPGNTGFGVIEIVVAPNQAYLPNGVTPTSAETYTAGVPLNDIYRPVLVNYVLYRAFQIDSDQPAASQRAQDHENRYLTALGVKVSTETIASPKTTNKDPAAMQPQMPSVPAPIQTPQMLPAQQ